MLNSLWVFSGTSHWTPPLSAVPHIQDNQVWRGSPEAAVLVSPDASMQPGCRAHGSSSRGCCVKAQDSSRLDSSAASKFQEKGVFLEQGPVVLLFRGADCQKLSGALVVKKKVLVLAEQA